MRNSSKDVKEHSALQQQANLGIRKQSTTQKMPNSSYDTRRNSFESPEDLIEMMD